MTLSIVHTAVHTPKNKHGNLAAKSLFFVARFEATYKNKDFPPILNMFEGFVWNSLH